MSTTKHTPSALTLNEAMPIETNRIGGMIRVSNEDRFTVAYVDLALAPYVANAERNAALVTELTEALSNLVNAVPNDGTWNYPAAMDAARRTLSKANPH